MQLHLLACVLLFIYRKHPRVTYFLSLGLSLLGAVTMVLVISYLELTPPSLVHILYYTNHKTVPEVTRYFFSSPWLQAMPFFLGTFLGQLLLEGKVVPLPRTVTRFLWILSSIIAIVVPFASYSKAQDLKSVIATTDYVDSVSMTLSLYLYSLSIFWFFYQCLLNPQNTLSRFLSSPIFQPFSRLSFCVYMSHFCLLWFDTYQQRASINVANIHELMRIMNNNLIVAYLLALWLYFVFEAPSVRLMKLFLRKKSTEKSKIQ